MKLITLNTWGGRVYEPFMDFLKANQDVDVFCFQEMYHRAERSSMSQGGLEPSLTLFDDITAALPNYSGYFRPQWNGNYGLAAFVRNELNLVKEEDCFVHKYEGYVPENGIANHARNVQSITIDHDGKNVTIFNFHGLWTGGGKGDSDDRLVQSQNLKTYMDTFSGAKILCGDFNLEPTTESLKILEDMPLRNLVKEYGVTSTRTSFYEKEVRFADYILVNDGVAVDTFRVMPQEVSDHSALELIYSMNA